MIQNISHQKQFEVIRLQMIAEENIKANRLKNEIIDKIKQLCETKVSENTRKTKIEEIAKAINQYAPHWVTMNKALRKIYNCLRITDHTDLENNYIEVNIFTLNKLMPSSNCFLIDEKTYLRLIKDYSFPIRFKPDSEIHQIMSLLKIEEMAI